MDLVASRKRELAEIRTVMEEQEGQLKKFCTRIDDLETQKVGELHKALQSQKEELQECHTEIRRLKQQLALGVSSEKKLIMAGESRAAQIFWRLMTAAPSIDDMHARKVAGFVDDHEDFEDELSLYCEVCKGYLRVHSAGWRLRMGISYLEEQEQDSLVRAVEEEIAEQRRLFPTRKLIHDTCKKCFDHLALSDTRLWSEWLKDCGAAAAKTWQSSLFAAFSAMFAELEKNKVNTEKFLLESWKPLLLLRAVCIFRSLELAASGAQVTEVEEPVGSNKFLVHMMSAYESAKRMMFGA